MGTLIDSSIWVDFFRLKTPKPVKEQVVSLIDDEGALLSEPTRFEILRGSLRSERKQVEETFATFPLIPSPADMWRQAIRIGQGCVDRGLRPRPMDLFISVVCLHHGVELITFDAH